MSQVLVWKCDKTGKLFEDKKKYRSHLAKLAAANRVRRKFEVVEAGIDAWWDEFRNRERSIEQLFEDIIANQDKFWSEAAKHNEYDWREIGKRVRKGVRMPVPKVVEITLSSVRQERSASNTHCCPVGGIQNWGGKVVMNDGTPAPRGYPGFCGHIQWYIDWPMEFDGCYPGGDLFDFRRSRIHTHSGSGGHRDPHGRQYFQYGFTVFLDDWPGVKLYYEKKQVMSILTTEGA